jgi:hypothetical protein
MASGYVLPILTVVLSVTPLVVMFGSDRSPFVFESHRWYHYRPLNRVKIDTYAGPLIIRYRYENHVLPEGFIMRTTPNGAVVYPKTQNNEHTTYSFWPDYIQTPSWERDQSGLELTGAKQFQWTDDEKKVYRKLTGLNPPDSTPLVHWAI